MTTGADSLRLQGFGLTDVGLVREGNEDAFFVSEQQGLFIVSDGMGGQRAGALASAMTIQALPGQIMAERLAATSENTSQPAQSVAVGLVRAIGFVNDMLLDKTKGHPEVKGLGATVVVAFRAENGVLALAHLGDSRAYLMRDGYLERLTSDHTVAEMLFQAGRISRRQLSSHPTRHTLTRHIGKVNCPAADTSLLPLRPGDRVLLCTDGLTGMLKDREIGTMLWQIEDQEQACRSLIDGANKAGGHDNITVVIVDVGERQRPRGRRREKIVVRRKRGRSLTVFQSDEKHEERTMLQI